MATIKYQFLLIVIVMTAMGAFAGYFIKVRRKRKHKLRAFSTGISSWRRYLCGVGSSLHPRLKFFDYSIVYPLTANYYIWTMIVPIFFYEREDNGRQDNRRCSDYRRAYPYFRCLIFNALKSRAPAEGSFFLCKTINRLQLIELAVLHILIYSLFFAIEAFLHSRCSCKTLLCAALSIALVAPLKTVFESSEPAAMTPLPFNGKILDWI